MLVQKRCPTFFFPKAEEIVDKKDSMALHESGLDSSKAPRTKRFKPSAKLDCKKVADIIIVFLFGYNINCTDNQAIHSSFALCFKTNKRIIFIKMQHNSLN